MENTAVQVRVEATTDYDQFSYLSANREIATGHVNTLAQIMRDNGNITEVQPIVVNQNMQVIDGQHRLEACKLLDMPVFYVVVPGLNVVDAREMNIAHKSWKTSDYARSYAQAGNQHYKEYLKLLEDYPFSHSVILQAVHGTSSRGLFAKLRKGELQIPDVRVVRERLDKLAEVGQFTPLIGERGFSGAVLKAMQSPDYSHSRMLKKIRLHGDEMLRRFANIDDNLRQLEDVYNFKMGVDNRIRFF